MQLDEQLQSQVTRCLKCKKGQCAIHCPVLTPISEVMTLASEGKLDEAARLLFENNPLSAITATVCPHERNCCGHCIRGLKSEPVEFYKLEQALSYDYLKKYEPTPVEKNKFRIAVVGAGPAGITASIILARKGFGVTLIDARERIGGVLRYGIPSFRLSKDIVDIYADILYKLGVAFKPNTFVGSSLTLDDMFFDGYDAIFIAVGTAKPRKLGLIGETLGNVYYAIDYLRTPEAYRIGKNVVVIGAGNVAMDAARMAIRYVGDGGKVTVVNNRSESDITADKKEVAEAVSEGVVFKHLLQTVKIEENGIVCATVEIIDDGASRDYYENFSNIVKLPADTVILAIGQGPQGAVLSESTVTKTERGFVSVDENGNTDTKGVFAAGDIVTGPKTVVEAVAFAKKVAAEIEKYCLT